MTRAFVAVRPPEAVLDAVAALDVRDVRATTREQWHITLQFLGNRADVDAVAAALEGTSFEGTGRAQLGGAGAFPSARRATVLWLGLVEGAELFAAVAAEVGRRLTPLGHEPEKRQYHPHLTLGRCKQPTDLRPVIASLGDAPVGPPWTVRELIVYESKLRRRGAEYLPRATVALNAGSRSPRA